MAMYGSKSELTLGSEKELEDVSELRRILEPELAALTADDKSFPHTTGDIFMTRLLRGNNGNIEDACTWFRKFIEMRKKYDLDRIHRQCESDSIPWVNTSLPHSSEILPHMTISFDEEKMITPGGHLLWFDSYGDSRADECFKSSGKDKLIEYMHFVLERRTSVLDRMSREQNRMVKIIRVMDFEGVGMWMMNSEYTKVSKEHIEPVMLGTSIEVVHLVFLINFPPWAMRVWKVASKIIPARLLTRFRIFGADFLQDKEFLSEVGVALITRCLRSRQRVGEAGVSDDGAVEGSGKIIAAGNVMERVIEVKAGQRVAWTYKVGTSADHGDSRGMLGKALDLAAGDDSTLTFSAQLLPLTEGLEDMDDLEVQVKVLEEPKVVDASHGDVNGSVVAETDGVVVLRWSNHENWVRAKVLASFKITAEANEGDVDADDILGDVLAAS